MVKHGVQENDFSSYIIIELVTYKDKLSLNTVIFFASNKVAKQDIKINDFQH